MGKRCDLTDEERRGRKRMQDRERHLRRMASPEHRQRKNLRDRERREREKRESVALVSAGHVAPRRPPPEVIAERDRAYAALDPITALLGDPPLGRRAIDHRENRT